MFKTQYNYVVHIITYNMSTKEKDIKLIQETAIVVREAMNYVVMHACRQAKPRAHGHNYNLMSSVDSRGIDKALSSITFSFQDIIKQWKIRKISTSSLVSLIKFLSINITRYISLTFLRTKNH